MTEKRVLRGNHCRCSSCGEYFNSVAAFDKHRIGDHGDRKCRTTDEMLAVGMAMSNGWWVTAQNSRAYLSSNSRSDDQEKRGSWEGVVPSDLVENLKNPQIWGSFEVSTKPIDIKEKPL